MVLQSYFRYIYLLLWKTIEKWFFPLEKNLQPSSLLLCNFIANANMKNTKFELAKKSVEPMIEGHFQGKCLTPNLLFS